jgi:predicted ArsR family transcriptional regulator
MNGQPGLTRSRNGANLGHAHLLNQRVILEIVRLHGPISRVDIARLTALTNQTVFNITEGLQQIGFIRDFGRRTAERGQPAKLFEINADAAFSVGLHLERDHITGLLVDFKGAIRSLSGRNAGVDPVHIPQILQGALQDEAVALGAAVLPMDDLIAPNYDRITRGEHPSLLELWETEN